MIDVKQYHGISGCELHEGDAVLLLALAEIRAPFEVEAEVAVRKAGEVGICFVVVCEVEQGWAGGTVPPGVLGEETNCAVHGGRGVRARDNWAIQIRRCVC